MSGSTKETEPDVLVSWKSLKALLAHAKSSLNAIPASDENVHHLPQAIRNAETWMKEALERQE